MGFILFLLKLFILLGLILLLKWFNDIGFFSLEENFLLSFLKFRFKWIFLFANENRYLLWWVQEFKFWLLIRDEDFILS